VPAHDRTCPAGQAEMIFRRCGWALAVVYAGVHVAAATELTAPVAVFRTDWGIQLGPITLIPGGFLAFTSLYRERNETADIASSFGIDPVSESTTT
jgi:hypothetical protein